MPKLSFHSASAKENATIQKGLTEYNIEIVPTLPRAKIHKIDLVLKDEEGNLLGGVNAEYVNWGILFIALLFIKKQYRSLGYGTRLLKEVEKLAQENGCYLAHTDTLEFQAKDFYLKHEYEVFGILDDCPKGHKRYYLKKSLI